MGEYMGTTTSHMSSARLCITLLCALGVATATVHVPWTAGFDDASARTKTVTTGDTLHFMWTGSHNVFQMASETAFNDCDFTGATDKGSISGLRTAFRSWSLVLRVSSRSTLHERPKARSHERRNNRSHNSCTYSCFSYPSYKLYYKRNGGI